MTFFGERMSCKEDWGILKEDKHFLVVAKPAGLVVQGAKQKDRSLLLQLKTYLKVRDHKPGEVFLAPVHRLDKPVSGALLLAKRSKAAKRFFQSMQEGHFKKLYLAVVEGELEGSGFFIDYLFYEKNSPGIKVYPTPKPGTKIAITYYKVIAPLEGKTLCLLSPLTGRKRQLRIALAHRGFPILGDKLYGAKTPLGGKILLHNFYLSFPHPTEKNMVEVICPLPFYFPSISLDKAHILEFFNTLNRKLWELRDVSS